MCMGGGGGGSNSSTRSARNAQISAQRRGLASESVVGYKATKGAWGDVTSSAPTLTEYKAPVPDKSGAWKAPDAAGYIGLGAGRQWSGTPVVGLGAGRVQSQYAADVADGRVPNYTYKDAKGKVLNSASAYNAVPQDGWNRSWTETTQITKDGKTFNQSVTKSQVYSGASTEAVTRANSLGRTQTDNSSALKASRKARAGTGLSITQSNSIVRSKRRGGLRIDSSGAQIASGGSGANVPV